VYTENRFWAMVFTAAFAACSSAPAPLPTFAAANLENATGDLIYFDGVNLFPGEKSGLRPLNLKSIDWSSGKTLTFDFTPPGRDESVTVRALVAHTSNQAEQPWIGVVFRLVAMRGGRAASEQE